MLEISGGATEDPLPADSQEVDVTEQQHHSLNETWTEYLVHIIIYVMRVDPGDD